MDVYYVEGFQICIPTPDLSSYLQTHISNCLFDIFSQLFNKHLKPNITPLFLCLPQTFSVCVQGTTALLVTGLIFDTFLTPHLLTVDISVSKSC